MRVYLDNAATTALDPEVLEAMTSSLQEPYGNPSSTHAHGRKARGAVEIARKKIASILHCAPGEIVFTSGGTEANNAIIMGAVSTYAIRRIVSSPIEHHAVICPVAELAKKGVVERVMVELDACGNVDYAHLERLLQEEPRTMVSLMHANNEVGNLLDLERVADLCHRYGAYFHSDMVQSIGHYSHDLKALTIHGLSASAHKFHGPQGVGFMYVNRNKKIAPYIYGGSQERHMRAGTENVAGIVGLAKAMEVAYRDLEECTRKISAIKAYAIGKLRERLTDIKFNGASGDLDHSLYTVLNLCLPHTGDHPMMLFSLDIEGISASGGGACSSGAGTPSHVIKVLCGDTQREAIRLSFSKYTTRAEIDYTVEKLSELCAQAGALKNAAS